MSYQYTVDRISDVQELLDRLIPKLLHLMDCEGLDGQPGRQTDNALSEILALRKTLRETSAWLLEEVDAESRRVEKDAENQMYEAIADAEQS